MGLPIFAYFDFYKSQLAVIHPVHLFSKDKAEKVLYNPKVGGPGPTLKSQAVQDTLAITFIVCMILSTWTNSLVMSAITGLILGMTTSAAHNFFHQADSWRMYYWDLSFLSSRDWRITHMLSHHLHTNTFKDIEVSGIEPYISFMPYADKNWVQRFFACFYINVNIFSFLIVLSAAQHSQAI